jgi:hypothetical protein
MTRIKTTAAVTAAAAALLALVSAGSGAALAATGCHIKLEAPAPRLVQSGETTLLTGALKCDPSAGDQKQTVTFSQRVAGSSTSTTIGTAETNTEGRFQFTTPALERNSAFTAAAAGVTSGHRAVKVSPKVSISGPPDGSIIYTRMGPILHAKGLTLFPSKVTWNGQVSPTEAGDEVVLQRENALSGEEWHRIGRTFVGPTGAYSISHVFSIPGAADIRVHVRRTKSNAAGISETLSYEILQAQNPNLTIYSSKNPLLYGEPVTITGEDKAGMGVKLTLFARNAGTKTFTAVATTTTTTGGAYAFPAQTPLQNTTYKVAAASPGPGLLRNSAALFEGVKFLLTAAPSATTVSQGSSVVFSGTVSPTVAGHAVYLQIQDLSGIGFHVVDVGTVSSTGTYSITYAPFVKGTRKYRIRVPGDIAHQGAASTLFSITTTESAFPIKLLPPILLPSEGH